MASIDVSKLKGSVLIVPSVSIGNVPQLASDLLLHNLNFEKIGALDAKYLYPFVSPTDYVESPQKGISTALEVFHSSVHNLTLIQQRSPIVAGFTRPFVDEVMLPFIEQAAFRDILFLDSGDCGLQETVAVSSIQEYTNEELLSKSLESLKIAEPLSLNDSPYAHSNYITRLVEALNGSVNLNVLVIYVYEGENFYEATLLAAKAVDKLGLSQVQTWARPVSWKGVYGDKDVPNAMEEGLYG